MLETDRFALIPSYGGPMIVFSRRKNESVAINDDITITVVEIRGDKIRLGVEARKEVSVLRSEHFEAIKRAEIATEAVVREEVSADARTIGEQPAEKQPDRETKGPPAPSHGHANPQKSEVESQRAEQLAKERDLWRDKYDQVLDKLIQAERDKQALRRALSGSDSGRVRMIECYEGIVRHREGDEAVVSYEVGDDLVEQTYRRDQFLDGNMPELNDQLAVHVRVLDIPPGGELGREGLEDHSEPFDKDDHAEPLSREF